MKYITVSFYLVLSFLLVLTGGCSESKKNNSKQLFDRLPSEKTGINFTNKLTPTEDFNTYLFRNFYNGGGVAIGDINNDGYKDIYLTGNQVPNKLYLNKGDLEFQDITGKAGVASKGVWSTGVAMADVNGDGWLDIYVCKSGPPKGKNRDNELFINNGDLTFSEKAEEYGLDVKGLSVQASFFDYDGDGDLDMYLLNNPIRSLSELTIEQGLRKKYEPEGGNKLFRNELVSPSDDKSAKSQVEFTEVTRKAGIYSSKIGFGLGVSVADVNRDGWPDIYISNDFFERDYLYINNKDGTFNEVLTDVANDISRSSMGGDVADLNGDGYPEIFVTDMLPGDQERLKSKVDFNTWKRFQEYIEKGYHQQFTRNTLQLNRGNIQFAGLASLKSSEEEIRNPVFSEIGRFAGVEATDWSWGSLIADFNLDGERELFVPNGIYRDLLDQDYLQKMSERGRVSSLIKQRQNPIMEMIREMPSNPLPNHMFVREAGFQFKNKAKEWGLGRNSFSNGSAYGDLDNDGALELVINNVNMKAGVYNNRAGKLYQTRNWLEIDLKGKSPLSHGTGSQVTVWKDGKRWFKEQQPVRGFQSTVDHTLHFGLGSASNIDSLVVRWSNGRVTKRTGLAVNQRLEIRHPEKNKTASDSLKSEKNGISKNGTAEKETLPTDPDDKDNNAPLLTKLDVDDLGLTWSHRENDYNDFDRQPLLFHMRSTEGPALCSGDINGDDRKDLFVGGAKGQPGVVIVQGDDGFREMKQPALKADRVAEDVDCTWFDADGDGDDDLYVASGSSELPASSSALRDRLYINDGTGRLIRSDQQLVPVTGGYESTGAVESADFDDDGDVDLFVGARLKPFAYGIPVDGHLLVNDGNGNFREATDSLAPGLRDLGMITDAEWGDVDGDGNKDLLIAGEWMPITLFENRNGKLVEHTAKSGLDSTSGWWNVVELRDLDRDGDLDIIGGNHGLNSRFNASPEKPVQIWTSDFDGNGVVEQIITTYDGDKSYPVALRHDLVEQIPSLKQDYPTYESYAGESVHDIFSSEQLNSAIHRKVVEMRSMVGWNDGEGSFSMHPLPMESQLAPMYGVEALDIDSDKSLELLMGGNLYEAKPQVGRYAASYGASIKSDPGKKKEMKVLKPEISGFFMQGQVRAIKAITRGDHTLIIVAKNNEKLDVFKNR